MMLEVVASLAIVVIVALCAASLAVGMGILQPANVPGPLMKILDEMTDRPLLKKLIAERVPTGQTIKIDPNVLREYLNRRVYAQEQVVNTIVEQIVLRFGKIKRTKPIGTFLISGPAGTGKTRMGKAIGEAIYGDEGYYLVEMNKLRSSEAMSVLFGAAPGLIGSDRQAGLVRHLIDHPQTVVILDEFEKASLEVQEAFLSAWTEGVIHDLSTGTKVSTKDAIFVLTANAKQDEIAALAERSSLDADDLSDRCKKLLREVFPAHILSRIDYVFAFQPLDEEAVAALAADMIAAEADSRGFKCEFVSAEILMTYVESFYGPDFDGRDLDRRIEKDFGDAFAKLRVKYPSLKQVDISYDKKTREMTFKPAKAA